MALKPKKPLISVVMQMLGVGFLCAGALSVSYFFVGSEALAAYAFPTVLTCFVGSVILVGFAVVIEFLNEIRWYLEVAHGDSGARLRFAAPVTEREMARTRWEMGQGLGG